MVTLVNKVIYGGIALSILSFIYIQLKLVSTEEHFEKASMIYTILSIFKIVGAFVLTKWYIQSERTESWRHFRPIKSQEYIPLDQFQYGQMTKAPRPQLNYAETKFQHTVEYEKGKMVIKVKPISQLTKESVDCDDSDVLVSSNDKIDEYDRKSGQSIFLS